MPSVDTDGLLASLLLAAFFILLLPPAVAAITGIGCGIALPGGQAGWGGFVGLGLGMAGVAINITGLFFMWFFLLPYISFSEAELARELFCPDHVRDLYVLERNSICRIAVRRSAELFWIGISPITPAAAAAGTWWLCRRQSLANK